MNEAAGWIVAAGAIGFIVGYLIGAFLDARLIGRLRAQIEEQYMTIDDLKEQLRALRDPKSWPHSDAGLAVTRFGPGRIVVSTRSAPYSNERSAPGPEAA